LVLRSPPRSASGRWGLGAAALSDQYGIMLAVPVLQLGASVGIERHTAGE